MLRKRRESFEEAERMAVCILSTYEGYEGRHLMSPWKDEHRPSTKRHDGTEVMVRLDWSANSASRHLFLLHI